MSLITLLDASLAYGHVPLLEVAPNRFIAESNAILWYVAGQSHLAPTDRIEARHLVVDVIYTPLETEFLLAAKARGSRTMGGAGMCVHQAAEAFRHFTGHAADVERMRRAFAAACAKQATDPQEEAP